MTCIFYFPMFGSNLLQFPRGSGCRARIDFVCDTYHLIYTSVTYKSFPNRTSLLNEWVTWYKMKFISYIPLLGSNLLQFLRCASGAPQLTWHQRWHTLNGAHDILGSQFCATQFWMIFYVLGFCDLCSMVTWHMGCLDLRLIALFHEIISHVSLFFVSGNLSISSSDNFSKIALCSWEKRRKWTAGILQIQISLLDVVSVIFGNYQFSSERGASAIIVII